MVRLILALALALGVSPAMGMAETAAETAAAFGAREGVEQASLSPDGTQIAFIAPGKGQGSTLFTVSTAPGATPKAALSVSGAPDRLERCGWVSDLRLVCTVWGLVKAPEWTLPLYYSRLFAVDAGGGNQTLLTPKQLMSSYSNTGVLDLVGGSVIDWLPDENGQVLMTRRVQRTDHADSNIGSTKSGLGVEKVDTRTLARDVVENPRPDAIEYITDGRGVVRIAGYRNLGGQTLQDSGVTTYRYRMAGSRDWRDLATYDQVRREGFNPYAVDAVKNVAYGFRKLDGRLALYEKALDGTGTETLLLSNPSVDVDGLIRVGRDRRVVGASFATETRQPVYFDADLKAMRAALGRALPTLPTVSIVDASKDGTKLLIHASADNDPGRYYLFDRTAKKLQILMLSRPALAGRTLATVRPVTYRAADGTQIPAYLTLPPAGTGKGLPAIVMPHGGPSARDEWGFDWLPQFFAARGYAVLQPNYRGSLGFGDAFSGDNAFRGRAVAIGDIDDAGRWLVAQGIAAPDRLAIVGWSFGGYAALQSAVTEPGLYKAVVAIAPVTDLNQLKADQRNTTGERALARQLGTDLASGSPAQNVARITVPVLLAHGTLDANVAYGQSTLMAGKLKGAGKAVELLTFDGLDHQLEDSAARTRLLERADGVIRAAIGG